MDQAEKCMFYFEKNEVAKLNAVQVTNFLNRSGHQGSSFEVLKK